MKKTIRKCFWAWDFDKEENWLNEMASKGFALDSVGFCKYTFKQTNPREYTIRLELLDNMPKNIESQKYIKFLEDTGVEYLGSVTRWVYFRKKTESGKFDLYSDVESRLKHLNRILGLVGIIGGVNFTNGINLTMLGIDSDSMFLILCGLFIVILAILIGWGFIKILKKKRELQKEQNLFQ